MTRRQTSLPRQWLIVPDRPGKELWRRIGRLPRGTGVLLLEELRPPEMRRLRHLAVQRRLTIATEHRTASRVHNVDELRHALLGRTSLILLSPLHPTPSHPDWRPLPRMRAAALARLAGRRLIALGGMSARRFARVKQLGFQGWAGVSAFRT